MARFCTQCGSPVTDDLLFCTQCGTKLREPQPAAQPQEPQERDSFCMHCGNVVPAGFKFCMSCGTPVGQTSPYAAPAAGASGVFSQPTEPLGTVPIYPLPQQDEPRKKGKVGLIIGIALAAVAVLGIVIALLIWKPWVREGGPVNPTPQNMVTSGPTDPSPFQNQTSGGNSTQPSNPGTGTGTATGSNATKPSTSGNASTGGDATKPSTGGNVSAGGAGDMPSDIAEYVIYDSNKRYLSESDLAGYTDRELWLARNEIYARHGRGFNNSELQNYFNSKSWYTKKYEASSFPDSLLNEYEKKNADTILKVEKKRGSSYVK